ncbi:MAG: hypothetical protein BA871_12760 [Desulfuromonadales bacterium C00003096]|nr:MAG: hypothetical protein BA871_12760 [Desulfuromonadales bacterium C00003096]
MVELSQQFLELKKSGVWLTKWLLWQKDRVSMQGVRHFQSYVIAKSLRSFLMSGDRNLPIEMVVIPG